MGSSMRAWRSPPSLAALLLGLVATASAQTVDTTTAQAVIGESVSLVIRVRAFDPSAGQIRPECLALRLQQGDSRLAIAPLQLQVTPSGDDGTALVRATSPEVVTDPFITGRLTLTCGAEYVREFTVLSDPPRPAAGASRPNQAGAAADRRTGQRSSRRRIGASAALTPASPALAAAPVAPPPASTPVTVTPSAAPAPPAPAPAPTPPTTAPAPAVAASTPRTSRSITRAEDPAPAASAATTEPATTIHQPSGVRLPETEVQALALAVLQALQSQGRAGSLPGTALSPGPAASSPAEMLLPWQELREEQRLTRATLAALQARLERTEREAWRDALVAMAVIIGLAMSLLLARIAREWALPRFLSMVPLSRTDNQSAHPTSRRWGDNDDFSDPGHAAPAAVKPATPTPITAPATTGGTHTAADMAIHWSPSLSTGLEHPETSVTTQHDEGVDCTPLVLDAGRDGRWPDADFGRPCLEDSLASIELLQELEAHTDSCPVGCVVVLESRLQDNSGKCPWILLRLLDLYEQLEQPWNRVRVAAQLETLYNVRLDVDTPQASFESPESPASNGAPATGPATLAEIEQAWALPDPAPGLAALLLRPTLVEVLGRAAFEEVLLLLTISHRRSTSVIAGNRTAPEEPGPLELLAA